MPATSVKQKPYIPVLDPARTETAIAIIKSFFQMNLAAELNLKRVTAPLLVEAGTGINDDLNGTEKPVRFPIPALSGKTVEIVQSLAKWKRMVCGQLDCPVGEGIYADMNAIRPDEVPDHLHSLYVDQWDWEKVISPAERNLKTLITAAQAVYSVIRRTETHLCHRYPDLKPMLPDRMTVVHADTLARRWPGVKPAERETRLTRRAGAVFVVGIGAPLSDGKPHDGRAPDYDDWTTPNGTGVGLNGDILVHHPGLDRAIELSSMGIRVDPETLTRQLELTGTTYRRQLLFHRKLLAGELPQTIGGGIGQSRLCMVLLRKLHIGEVQAGVWPDEMRDQCAERGIPLL